jgi:hypothetical protein
MTADDFRRVALQLPGATENAHMGHPDFRVNGKIFATLNYPDENWGMVKLPPEQQDDLSKAQPKVFVPVKGAWGRQGSTNVLLEAVDPRTLEQALRIAFDQATVAARNTTDRKRSGAKRTGKTPGQAGP